MSTETKILTDEQIEDIAVRCSWRGTAIDTFDFRARAIEQAVLNSPEVVAMRKDAQFLQEDDLHSLYRFIETTEDCQEYDIGKERVQRLAELGVVSNQSFGRYSVTAFGYWVHERYWHQNPSLPLKTNDEHNAQAAIDARRRIEGESNG